MPCSDKVNKLGNGPQGGKLMAKFSGPDMPDEVNVKGTTDSEPIRGNSGNWISRDKYTTPQVTLVLKRNGVPFKECTYDIAGNLIVNTSDASVQNFSCAASGGVVTLSWQSVSESGLSIYSVERKQRHDYEAVNGAMPMGPGSTYRVDDFPDSVGTYFYRLKAVFNDGTEKILLTDQPVNI